MKSLSVKEYLRPKVLTEYTAVNCKSVFWLHWGHLAIGCQ